MRTILLAFAYLAACSSGAGPSSPGASPGSSPEPDPRGHHTQSSPPPGAGQAVAIFAGGCFWCEETAFEGIPGVLSVLSGYTGGEVDGASYEEVSSGGTGHAEAVRVLYDPAVITYPQLLEIFWHNVDPTQREGQFCDHGHQYRSAIFVATPDERRLAEESRGHVAETIPGEIATEIDDAAAFWVAEDYHQDYFRTHAMHYAEYRMGCGRDERLHQIWGDLAGTPHGAH